MMKGALLLTTDVSIGCRTHNIYKFKVKLDLGAEKVNLE